ncbi:uncharacterized protein LOC122392189 isoform X10 [Amphibalanus amphitrite]|uniref:uncharacterized protein LOC122392189 isoform X10 n=1 Tax=Amphibalanus amphitrite TaxID=1232801 RepID=UPI001C91795B|nr:uncharacterized protein LOC122392189 isoform X10 [Amphibalanus amphitrite]
MKCTPANAVATFQEIHPTPELKKPKSVLRTYTGAKIPVVGEFIADVKYNNQARWLPLVVVGGDGPNLLGRDWLGNLKLDWFNMFSNDCLQRTSAVLEKLQDAGLRVSEKKCKFCVDSVEYLGHRIDAEGCHPTEAKSLEEEFALDSSRIAALTSRDTLLSRVRQAIETGEWPDEEDIRSFFHRRDELSVIRGVLLWGSRVVVPAKAQKHVLHELHEGHPGVRPPGHHRLGQRSGLHRGGVPAVHEEERHPSCEDGSSQAGVRQSLRQRLRELTGLVARSGRLSPRCNDGGGPAGRWSTVAPSLRSAAVCGRLCSEESHGDGRLRLRTAAGEAGPGGWRAGRGLVGGRSAGGSRGDLGPETGG